MITIQTVKTNKVTGDPIYKDYRAVNDLNLTMEEINADRMKNELDKYSHIEIYNIFES